VSACGGDVLRLVSLAHGVIAGIVAVSDAACVLNR